MRSICPRWVLTPLHSMILYFQGPRCPRSIRIRHFKFCRVGCICISRFLQTEQNSQPKQKNESTISLQSAKNRKRRIANRNRNLINQNIPIKVQWNNTKSLLGIWGIYISCILWEGGKIILVAEISVDMLLHWALGSLQRGKKNFIHLWRL